MISIFAGITPHIAPKLKIYTEPTCQSPLLTLAPPFGFGKPDNSLMIAQIVEVYPLGPPGSCGAQNHLVTVQNQAGFSVYNFSSRFKGLEVSSHQSMDPFAFLEI